MQAGTDGFTYSRPSSILVEPEFVEYDVSNNIILLKYHHTNIKGRELFFEIIAKDSFINLSSNKLNLWKEGYLREKCEYRDIVETFGIETKPFTQLTFEKIYEFPKTIILHLKKELDIDLMITLMVDSQKYIMDMNLFMQLTLTEDYGLVVEMTKVN